jgi:hypothetical protein
MWKPMLASLAGLVATALLLGCSEDRKPLSSENEAPRINSLRAEPDSVWPSGSSQISSSASDGDQDDLQYQWAATEGILVPQGATTAWTAPATAGDRFVRLRVSDGHGGEARDSVRITVFLPPNLPPVITQLTADRVVAAPGDTVRLACRAFDGDGDPLQYAWVSSGGSFEGEGAAVGWVAPAVEGVYPLHALVTDGQGGEARDTLAADVFAGTLLLQTRNGLTAVRLDGSHWVLASEWGRPVEVVGTRIYVKDGREVVELDHHGVVVAEIQPSDPVVDGYGFALLPDGGFVHLSNRDDVMHFMAADGTFRQTVAMPNPSPESLQNMDGVIAGNRLIVSETGNNDLIAVDLTTLSASIFRTIEPGGGWLGAIDYDPGRDVFYICRSQRVQSFTEGGEVQPLATLTGHNITGAVALGSYLYVCLNFEGTVRRINRLTGEETRLVGELNYPQDIEYLPVRLEP